MTAQIYEKEAEPTGLRHDLPNQLWCGPVSKPEGGAQASFVNLPTKAYDPTKPDKSRVAYPDPRIPFTFD